MEKNTQHKAVIYCRVSTKEQAEEGNSLNTQERNCREYAQKYNLEVSQVFIEQGESAKTADRTELQKLLRFCSDKKQNIKTVIIYKIDRLSRNTDDYSQLRILLKRYGVEIKSTSEYFENTPAGRFMENIIANVAQFDNDVRTERSVGGMRDAARDGRYVWTAPVGYKNQKVEGKSTIVPSDKAALVKTAFEMMADRKHSINAIRDTLSFMGLGMVKSQFYKMLKNEIYTGWICKFGERYQGKFEPLISEALYNRVQQVMRNRKMPLLYTSEHPDFPLRRFVKHPNGLKLTGAWSQGRKKKYAYYRFIKAKLQWPKIELETGFSSFMDKYAFNEEILDKLKVAIVARFSNKSDIVTKNFDAISTRKQHLKDNQTILIQKNISGIISDSLLKEHLLKLEQEIWDIDKTLMMKEDRKINVERIFAFISEFLLRPSLTWKKMPLDIKVKLQWFEFPEGLIFNGKEFRTTKISSIFKLKQFFLPDKSPTVPYPVLYYKHDKSANFPALSDTTWKKVEDELVFLEEVIRTIEYPPPE